MRAAELRIAVDARTASAAAASGWVATAPHDGTVGGALDAARVLALRYTAKRRRGGSSLELSVTFKAPLQT